jgi:hypothetical protein
MAEQAAAHEPGDLHRREFRPEVLRGESGWGAKGELDLAKVRAAGGN